MLSEWHSCPREILQRCFSDQLDYSDNAAAACACKPWRESFTSASRAITLMYCGVRTDASPSYLRQHTDLTSLTLINLPTWDNVRSWLHVAHDALKYHSIALSTWSETLGAVSATCKQLTLDHFLPGPDHTIDLPDSILFQTFSHFSLLQHLTLHDGPGNSIAIEALSGLLGLRSLAVSCKGDSFKKVTLVGSLTWLPPYITRLQLHNCAQCTDQHPQVRLLVEDLAHLQSLQDLDLYNTNVHCELVALSWLSLLTRLVSPFVSVQEQLLHLTGLRVLCLRRTDVYPAMPLENLLHRLSSLQELDILETSGLVITPADCKFLTLVSFAFEADMLMDIHESSFDHFVSRAQTPDLVSQPFLRMDSMYPRFQMPNLAIPKLFYAVTHLTLTETPMWPAIFELDEIDLPLLRVLDFRFPMLSRTIDLISEYDRGTVAVSPQLNLAELYIMDSHNSSFNLGKCTSLRSIGITHRGPDKPAIGLPPFLTRLCLHNVLSASSDLQLERLQDLSSVKLGGRVASTDVTRQLPSLPQSIIELDLWDGLLTDLQQLSRLTNLKKLFMPFAPNQQRQTIRQLRQLRHVEVTGREGMHYEDGRPKAPWLFQ